MPQIDRRRRTARPGALALVVVLALLVVTVLILTNTVFVVKAFTVEGNRYCTKEEVIQASGIAYGDSMFAIDSIRVREGINGNRYLQYASMWRDFPSTVILTVKEHAPRATFTSMGTLVVIGENCVVLEQSDVIDVAPQVPVVTGMQVSSVRVGSPVVFGESWQGEAIDNVLTALEAQQMIGEVSELNVATLDNLYLVTEDGMQVVLGDDEDLDEKLALLRAVLPRLRDGSEIRGSILDVSTADAADYRPASH